MDGSDSPSEAPVYWIVDISEEQQAVLFILDGISGALSVLGASFLFYLIWNSTKSHALSPRHRILFGLSFFDFIGSLRTCVSGFYDIHHKRTKPGPMCTVNGFIHYISYAAPFYNLFLSFYYYLTIRGGMSTKTFEQKYEKWCHAVAILYPLTFGIVGLPFGIFNPAGGFRPGCVAAPYPQGCFKRSDMHCTRGHYALIFLFANIGAVFSFFPLIIGANILIFSHVRKLENSSRRFSLSGARAAKTRKVATQCFLYVFVFIMTWIWTIINLIVNLSDTEGFESGKYYGLLVMGHFFNPLQGFGNLVVYLRPIYLQLRESDCTRWEAFSRLLHHNRPNGQPNSNVGAIFATMEDQRSQLLMLPGHFQHTSQRFSSQQFTIPADNMDENEKGTEQLSQDVTQQRTNQPTTEEVREVLVTSKM